MSLYSIYKSCPNAYLVTALNSEFLFTYYREFINCTVNIQINDIRKLPIIIPSETQLDHIQTLFNKIIDMKKDQTCEVEVEIEKFLDLAVSELYGI